MALVARGMRVQILSTAAMIQTWRTCLEVQCVTMQPQTRRERSLRMEDGPTRPQISLVTVDLGNLLPAGPIWPRRV